MMSDYTKNGGKWLAACRTWIQNHCINGSSVIWGSDTALQPPITAHRVEEMAAAVADAANAEADELRRQLNESRKKCIELEGQVKKLRDEIEDLEYEILEIQEQCE